MGPHPIGIKLRSCVWGDIPSKNDDPRYDVRIRGSLPDVSNPTLVLPVCDIRSHPERTKADPKAEANALWVRFRAARGTIDNARRAYFADLDTTHRQARDAKQALVDKAEALSSQGAAAIPTYRALLDSWKAAGRAGKKLDDALWAKFKAAGDALYSAKAEVDAKDSVEFGANLEAKLALLVEAEALVKETDRLKAKEALLSIQKRWDKVGKVPRDQVRVVDDRLRLVETEVRKLDEEHWQKNNPERQQRSDGFAGQLAEAIAKLERELDEARAKGDEKKIAVAQEALDARKAWLGAVKS